MDKMIKREDLSSDMLFGAVWSILLAFAVTAVCAISVSPIYEFQGFDSSIFRVVGRAWAEGGLPYVDAWDSKGPIIFAINALGEAIGGRWALWVLESLATALSFFIAWRFFMLCYPRKKSLWLTLGFAMVAGAMLDYGNRTESYDLPFLMLSYLCLYRSVRKGEYAPWMAMIYGMTLGVTLWFRLLDFAGVSIGVVIVAILLCVRGKWKVLALNALSFLGGLSIVVLPVVIWAQIHGILDEMWFATFTYNVAYLTHGGSNTELLSWARIPGRLHLILLPVVTAAISIFLYLKGDKGVNRREALFWGVMGLGMTCVMMAGRGYAHYALTTLPLLCVSVLLIRELPREVGQRVAGRSLGTVMAALIIWSAQRIIRNMLRSDRDDNLLALVELAKAVPSNELKELWLYEVDPGTYIRVAGLRPQRAIFCLQNDLIDLWPERFEAEKNYLQCRQPKWVLTDTCKYGPMKPVLSNYYNQTSSIGSLVLFRRLEEK